MAKTEYAAVIVGRCSNENCKLYLQQKVQRECLKVYSVRCAKSSHVSGRCLFLIIFVDVTRLKIRDNLMLQQQILQFQCLINSYF